MPRPIEYDNLIKTGAFEAVAATPGAAQSYLGNASDYLDAAQNAGRSMKPRRCSRSPTRVSMRCRVRPRAT
jgi:hypothetical protein